MPKRRLIQKPAEKITRETSGASSKFLGFILLAGGLFAIFLSLIIGLCFIARPYHLATFGLVAVFSDTLFTVIAALLLILAFFLLCYYIAKFGKF